MVLHLHRTAGLHVPNLELGRFALSWKDGVYLQKSSQDLLCLPIWVLHLQGPGQVRFQLFFFRAKGPPPRFHLRNHIQRLGCNHQGSRIHCRIQDFDSFGHGRPSDSSLGRDKNRYTSFGFKRKSQTANWSGLGIHCRIQDFDSFSHGRPSTAINRQAPHSQIHHTRHFIKWYWISVEHGSIRSKTRWRLSSGC